MRRDARPEPHRAARCVPPSEAPDGLEAAWVEPVVAAPAGADDDVVEDRGDDRVLARERQGRPPVPQGRSVADVPVERRGASEAA